MSSVQPAAQTLETAHVAYASLEEFEKDVVGRGAKPMHLRVICRAWLGRAEWPAADDDRFPKKLREAIARIRARFEAVLSVRSRHPGADPESERLLLTLADGQTIESVLLPRRGICVSTQLGCAVGCVFCMTGKCGLIRQLADIEIAAEAALARRLRPETKKVVFMGMGEPSHNLANVFRALAFFAEYGDFGHKNLVISTVGDKRLFAALDCLSETRGIRPALAVSLHTVDDEKRRALLPNGARMTVDELLDAAERRARLTGYPTQFEWTLIKDVNDSLDEAAILAEKLKGHYAMVNFIPVNTVPDSSFRRPELEHAADLVRALRARGVIATLRDSAAQDVDGGCGQLRARVLATESK